MVTKKLDFREITRSDLGDGVKDKVTALNLPVRITWEIKKIENRGEQLAFCMSEVLRINGEKQTKEDFEKMTPTVFNSFIEVFIQLVPFSDRQACNIITVKEEQDFLNSLKPKETEKEPEKVAENKKE